ncbi:MAG: DsbA family protein [Bdellovibrionota bacterium]
MSISNDLILAVSDRDHVEGDAAAPITLVEYGDYECPYCASAHPIIQNIRSELGPQLRFVFRNFPLTQMHQSAELAAEAAEAAGAQGKFWEMHDALYAQPGKLGVDHILSLAANMRMDENRIFEDLRQRKFLARVREDFASGVRSGVDGTPAFFVNGRRYRGSWDMGPFLANLKRALPGRMVG